VLGVESSVSVVGQAVLLLDDLEFQIYIFNKRIDMGMTLDTKLSLDQVTRTVVNLHTATSISVIKTSRPKPT
jgi:hypothetical protein